jgi:hypothetical protein
MEDTLQLKEYNEKLLFDNLCEPENNGLSGFSLEMRLC